MASRRALRWMPKNFCGLVINTSSLSSASHLGAENLFGGGNVELGVALFGTQRACNEYPGFGSHEFEHPGPASDSKSNSVLLEDSLLQSRLPGQRFNGPVV